VKVKKIKFFVPFFLKIPIFGLMYISNTNAQCPPPPEANCFYQANVPFNVVRHPSFIAAVRATSLARFNYEPPSYHAMRTTFIEPTKKHVEAEVKKDTKQSIEIYGATICTDGWDNVTRQPQ
jgi:hypothetical protein